MTIAQDKTLQIGIAGSLVMHVLLLLAFVWVWSQKGAAPWLGAQKIAEEKEVVLLFPDQVIEAPPPPIAPPPAPSKPQPQYVRTNESQKSAAAPLRADFVSDRNTIAASAKAPAPDATANVPTMDGLDKKGIDLANQKQNDATPPAMRVPETPSPRSALDELDKTMARVETARLPLEVKRAEPPGAQSETRATKLKGTISNLGEASVNAMETPKARFMHMVDSAVNLKWEAAKKNATSPPPPGEVSLRFYVTSTGKIEEMEITSDKATTDPRLMDFVLRALAGTEIPPIPDDLIPMLKGGRFVAEYNVLFLEN